MENSHATPQGHVVIVGSGSVADSITRAMRARKRSGADDASVTACDLDRNSDLDRLRGARAVVLASNAHVSTLPALLRGWLPELMRAASDTILLVATHPVEAITDFCLRETGWPAERVIGVGTVAETTAFRRLIASRLRVSPREVAAFIVGERGEGIIPLWSTACVGTIPLHQWAVMGHGRMTVRDRTEIFVAVKQSSRDSIEGSARPSDDEVDEVDGETVDGVDKVDASDSTPVAVDSVESMESTESTESIVSLPSATMDILRAILRDENRILTVSRCVSDYREIDDVCLSLPCIVGRTGAEPPIPLAFNEAERAGLRAAVEAARVRQPITI
jgi:L-lactate dehydrogenase